MIATVSTVLIEAERSVAHAEEWRAQRDESEYRMERNMTLLLSRRPDERERRGSKPRRSDARFASEARAEVYRDRDKREGGRKPPGIAV